MNEEEQGLSPPVFIILVNWNNWRDTLECLNSLERLDYSNKIIVVDNGSTDESEARLREAYPEITLLQAGSNLGFAGGNNRGIQYALEQGADFVWLLNNDTVSDPDALTAMIRVAQSSAEVGAVGSVIYSMNEQDKVQFYGGGWVCPWAGISRDFTASVSDSRLHYVTGGSLLIRKGVLKSIGLLDDNFFLYWEDVDYGFRLRKAGWKLAVAPDSKIWHKDNVVERKSPLQDKRFSFSATYFLKKHYALSIVPIFISVGLRLFKRIVRRDWEQMIAVLHGAFSGWKRAS